MRLFLLSGPKRKAFLSKSKCTRNKNATSHANVRAWRSCSKTVLLRPKQLDDLDGQLALVDRKKAAHLRSILTANRGISSEIAPIKAQIDQIDDQIRRTKVLNPMTGRVMAKFAEQSEMVSPMRPLYKIAKTDEVILRVYVSGSQLPHIALGQTVSVEIDENSTDNRELSGKITWIAEEAEFTPKTIQTKEDRVNLVYAVKIIVPNPEGKLKTGMPAEVNWGG